MYDPALSTVDDYRAMAQTVGIDRMVVVQASIYGTDNRCLVNSIERLGVKNTRGIAVVDQSITLNALRDMDRRGVRGIRFNAITGRTPIEWLPALAKMIEPLGWHIQLWTNSARLLEIGHILNDVPLPIVLDHMGQFPAAEGVQGNQFQNILRLMKDDRFWIKLVGYRVSKAPPAFEDIREAAKVLVSVAPEHCLWAPTRRISTSKVVRCRTPRNCSKPSILALSRRGRTRLCPKSGSPLRLRLSRAWHETH